MNKTELVAKIIEELERPIPGNALSRTYGELFDLLSEDGYLHEGERELLAEKIAQAIAAEVLKEKT